MKTKIIDKVNNRTIIKDYDESSITIIGDYSSSSIKTYWVINQFNTKPYAIFITRESAQNYCDNRNKEYNTKTFMITERTIFV